jgi:hypothetical protein
LKKRATLVVLTFLSWLPSVVWFGFIIAWLIPYSAVVRPLSPETIASYSSYHAATAEASVDLRASLPHLRSVVRIGVEPLTPLVFVEYQFTTSPNLARDSLEFQPLSGAMKLRYDRLLGFLIVLAGFISLGLFIDFVLWKPWKNEQTASKEEEPTARKSIGSLRDSLDSEILYSEDRCLRVYATSNILLMLGAFVALSGLGVLYFLFPSKPDSLHLAKIDPQTEIFLQVRAFAVVAYIEAFALLILKQYRLSQDDYAYFNGIRTRNAHFLNSLLALKTESPDIGKWFSDVLLTEDPLRGRRRRETRAGAESTAVGSKGEELLKPILDSLKALRDSTSHGSLEK